jgi:hypothetical protein
MKIRKETNTQVAVEDFVPGSEERVVTIIAERCSAQLGKAGPSGGLVGKH